MMMMSTSKPDWEPDDAEVLDYKEFLEPEDIESIYNRVKEKGFPKNNNVKLRPKMPIVKFNILPDVKGSTYMENNGTKVIVTIEPPREIMKVINDSNERGIVTCTARYAPFAINDYNDLQAKQSQLNISIKKAIFPTICRGDFPNMQIDIFVYVLDDRGSVISSAINCVVLALIDNYVPLYTMLASSTIGIYRGLKFINPCDEMEELFPFMAEVKEYIDNGMITATSYASIRNICDYVLKGYMQHDIVDELFNNIFVLNHIIIDRYKILFKERETKEQKVSFRKHKELRKLQKKFRIALNIPTTKSKKELKKLRQQQQLKDKNSLKTNLKDSLNVNEDNNDDDNDNDTDDDDNDDDDGDDDYYCHETISNVYHIAQNDDDNDAVKTITVKKNRKTNQIKWLEEEEIR